MFASPRSIFILYRKIIGKSCKAYPEAVRVLRFFIEDIIDFVLEILVLSSAPLCANKRAVPLDEQIVLLPFVASAR